jgi:hypothetical protein
LTVAFGIACGLVSTASAATIFTLAGSVGTITLSSHADDSTISTGTVKVVESLAPNVYANTGAGDSLEFSLAGHPAITVSNITSVSWTGPAAPASSAFTLDINPTAPHGANIGGFGYGINCTACGSGTSTPNYNALSFLITDSAHDLTPSSFIVGDKDGFFFISDIGVLQSNGRFSTGNVGATGPGVLTGGGNSIVGAPEPASMLRLGAGLIGLGAVRRWR